MISLTFSFRRTVTNFCGGTCLNIFLIFVAFVGFTRHRQVIKNRLPLLIKCFNLLVVVNLELAFLIYELILCRPPTFGFGWRHVLNFASLRKSQSFIFFFIWNKICRISQFGLLLIWMNERFGKFTGSQVRDGWTWNLGNLLFARTLL